MKLNPGNRVGIHILLQLLVLVLPVGLLLVFGTIGARKAMERPEHGDPFLGVALLGIFLYVCWIAYLLLQSVLLHFKRKYALRNADLVMALLAVLLLAGARYVLFT